MNVIVCERYGFFCVLAAIMQTIPLNDVRLRMVKVLPFIHQPDRVARKASAVSASDTHIFFTCVVTAFLRAGNHCV